MMATTANSLAPFFARALARVRMQPGDSPPDSCAQPTQVVREKQKGGHKARPYNKVTIANRR